MLSHFDVKPFSPPVVSPPLWAVTERPSPEHLTTIVSRLHQEHSVLSAHEFATLMLVKDSADHIADREEPGTLLERQLVALERLTGGALRPRITEDGESLLRNLAFIN